MKPSEFTALCKRKGYESIDSLNYARRPVGRVEATKPQQVHEAQCEGANTIPKQSTRSMGTCAPSSTGTRIHVELHAFLRRPYDDDNLTGGLKPLRDAIAERLGIDDGSPSIKFTVHQQQTRGPQGVLVKIHTEVRK